MDSNFPHPPEHPAATRVTPEPSTLRDQAIHAGMNDRDQNIPAQVQPRVAARSEGNPSRHPNLFLLGSPKNREVGRPEREEAPAREPVRRTIYKVALALAPEPPPLGPSTLTVFGVLIK